MNSYIETTSSTISNQSQILNKITDPSDELKKIFFSELNLSLALPFKERVRGKAKGVSEAIIKVCDENTNNVLKIATRSPRGALSGMAYDVLVTLLDMACEQLVYHVKNEISYNLDSFKVYFSNREICERLHLNLSNSQGNITEAIQELREVNINVLGHIFDLKTKDYNFQDKDFSLISSMSKSVKMKQNFDIEGSPLSLRHIVFDRFIVDLLSSEFGVNRTDYLKLRSGKERRTLSFLTAKRHIFGNIYSFDIDEIASVIGDDDKRQDNKKSSINKVLKKIKNTVPGFDYCMKSVYGQGRVEILVEFNSNDQIEEKYETEMFGELVYFYSKEELDKIDFHEFDYMSLRSDLEKKHLMDHQTLKYEYYKEKIDIIDMALDLAMYQIIKTGYDKIKTKKLTKIILASILKDQLELPEGYRYFITRRNKDLRKKIEQDKIQKEILKRQSDNEAQEKIKNKNYRVFFETYVEPNVKLLAKYSLKAQESLVGNPNFELDEISIPEIRNQLQTKMLSDTIFEISKEDYFNNGEIITDFFNKNAKEVGFGDISSAFQIKSEQTKSLH